MHRNVVFFPGKIGVVFRKGPLGFLLQEPTQEARRIKEDPTLQDKSAPLKSDRVRENALAVVRQRGGDSSDRTEVLGQYILQFGKYKGKSFRWLLENDVGYTMYLIKSVQKEEVSGLCMAEGHSKDSLQAFVHFALSFAEIQSVLHYEASGVGAATASSEDDQLVGFGSRAKSTWKEIWDSRADGYADFIVGKTCIPGTRMHKLQQYLQKRRQLASVSTRTDEHAPRAPAKPLVMDEDEELERAMLSISPSKLQVQSFTVPAVAVTPGVSSGAKPVTSVVLPKPPPYTSAQLQSAPVDGVKRKSPLPIPKELAFLVKETAGAKKAESAESTSGPSTSAAHTNVDKALAFEDSGEDAPSVDPPVPVPVASHDHDMSNWSCSRHQKLWMKTELQDLGLWPGSRPVRNPANTISLWRLPPQPELIDMAAELPSPNFFQLHPFFIWKPESDIMVRLRNNYNLPCLHGCSRPQVVSAGVGRPRVIVGTSGQYYILASRLCCKACRRNWFADSPRWLEKLPKRFTSLLPALLTYKKAICKSVMDELRRSGNSPTDMAKQVNELMRLKYERAHLAYLRAIESVRDAEAGMHGQPTIGQFMRKENKPRAFGPYEDPDGWCGISVSGFYLTDCLLDEYRRQEPAISKLLQGTFGQIFRSDHTRKVARKVTLASGVMSSYAIMNENWLIVSWVMVQSETERSLELMYQGMAKRYSDAGVEKAGYHWMDRDCCAPFKIPDSIPGEHLHWDAWKTTPSIIAHATSGHLENTCASRSHYNANIVAKLDLFHCLRRFSRECTSEHHPLFSNFCQLLSAAFSVVDQEDLNNLRDAYVFCGIHPANPTKQHVREHCRTKIPQPMELLNRVEKVLRHFHLATDPNDVPLFKSSMLKTWRIQRVHILRGCLSDPELSQGIMYRYGGTLQLNHIPGEGAKVPIWIPVRGTSQQEGYHFHQAQWITGTHVSTELFQAQGMMGVARWNYQRLVDLKQPEVTLPAVFDPALIAELNSTSKRVTGQEKYPILHLSNTDTGERFGLEYREPGCRPVPLDWDKHKRQKRDETAAPVLPSPVKTPTSVQAPNLVLSSSRTPFSGMASSEQIPSLSCSLSAEALIQQVLSEDQKDPPAAIEISHALPLPLKSSPRSARTGPIKTGGRVFVLDHTRWTPPMKDAIDRLLQKYHGEKNMLKLVDQDYADMVHQSATDPNSLLHPTTRLHICRYVKHLAKLLNTSSSLNTSQEKLLQTQQLWHSLTEGSETTSVPVVTMEPAIFSPPAPALLTPVTEDSIKKMVEGVVEKWQQQQHQQQPEVKSRQTKTCLACGQPKSRYETDGSSSHFFYQQGPVRYFYCSQRVHQSYAADGLSNPNMPFEEFARTEFFQRELEATKKRVEEKKDKKRKRPDSEQAGRRCRFCHRDLKQGPNSPHIHTGFPGVAGKYIYCPSKVYSLYQQKGMAKEMTWKEFQKSPFYEAERQRWVDEKKK
ncbi:uncharacterized protein LOC143482626 isoform X2 [Brachyhypopomus gauderio]|uniref:uncharacterized protein LOC143482624 isoform X2 n=1 Tax=Brachyhypopomus gauderio TaxID=698409 RepID=UPI0040417EED